MKLSVHFAQKLLQLLFRKPLTVGIAGIGKTVGNSLTFPPIVGDMEGQFNVKLDYTDGSTEFLKTFCSEGSYLIEQL